MYAVNQIPVIDLSKSETGCCTLIDPKEWDEQTFTFDNKLFAKASTRSFLFIPLNMGSVMTKAQAKIDAADARESAFMILSQDVSPWRANHYFAVSKDVPGLATEKFTGTYMAKVFEGPFKDAPKWYKQLIEYVKSKGKEPVKTYLFYTTCPGCAKVYGKNYVIGFEQVK
jgi:hypothetical protein